jgi:hypothetical protein
MGRLVITSAEETEDVRLTAGSFGIRRAAKLRTAFSTARSLVSNGPVYVAFRFRPIDVSIQYHPFDRLSAFPKN